LSQRNSGYARKENNFYPTPAWVTELIIPEIKDRIRMGDALWEPCCGEGHMSAVLDNEFPVWKSDINKEHGNLNFLWQTKLLPNVRGIVTNPPYGPDGTKIVQKALELTQPVDGFVMMLLRVDYDSAKTRRWLFEDCAAWGRKMVLRKRIKWFETGNKSGPSTNHAWYIWDWSKTYLYPEIVYAP
jgi:hypothetical protein